VDGCDVPPLLFLLLGMIAVKDEFAVSELFEIPLQPFSGGDLDPVELRVAESAGAWEEAPVLADVPKAIVATITIISTFTTETLFDVFWLLFGFNTLHLVSVFLMAATTYTVCPNRSSGIQTYRGPAALLSQWNEYLFHPNSPLFAPGFLPQSHRGSVARGDRVAVL
jgi:hypothetical protein